MESRGTLQKTNARLDTSRSNDDTRPIGPNFPGSWEKEYVVSFDMNPSMDPRNIDYAREWVIVLIVSLGSLCVDWSIVFRPPLRAIRSTKHLHYILTLFLIWLVPCAVARNIQTMIIARFFNGPELAAPMMIYTASPFIGPEIGPLVGGFINTFTTWYPARCYERLKADH
ncbi:hypothetical protein Aspvir_003229 [Aspergillus viridinutans]|uniref:Uncharacterized protein n=1 Tax=Aspergillus viridinutans TaxID=75553 RepID=A0A9P3C7F9_ASPVI|nr:uncharacterized protein Aspvir_003229 [Aspergillus viridinutans]GIK07563.1 hypothetical protein Aspvir_003229 [Aspergillus viridinutans]